MKSRIRVQISRITRADVSVFQGRYSATHLFLKLFIYKGKASLADVVQNIEDNRYGFAGPREFVDLYGCYAWNISSYLYLKNSVYIRWILVILNVR